MVTVYPFFGGSPNFRVCAILAIRGFLFSRIFIFADFKKFSFITWHIIKVDGAPITRCVCHHDWLHNMKRLAQFCQQVHPCYLDSVSFGELTYDHTLSSVSPHRESGNCRNFALTTITTSRLLLIQRLKTWLRFKSFSVQIWPSR